MYLTMGAYYLFTFVLIKVHNSTISNRQDLDQLTYVLSIVLCIVISSPVFTYGTTPFGCAKSFIQSMGESFQDYFFEADYLVC